MPKFSVLAYAVAERMSAGESLDEVEDDVIESADLDEDAKAALWLYARSFVPNPQARAEAMSFIRMLDRERTHE